MSIYPSTKPAPYVYQCTNRITGEFYFGSRYGNVKLNRSSDIDFPKYKTSSKKVNPIFNEFDWMIIAEFFNEDDAYDFEQVLIREHWNNPLLLNMACFDGSKRFKITLESSAKSATSRKGKKVSLETKAKISASLTGKKLSAERCAHMIGKKHSLEARAKMSAAHKGEKHSPERIAKNSKSQIGKKRGPNKKN